MIVFLARDIPPFVMYCVNGKPRSSLFIESTDSMILVTNLRFSWLPRIGLPGMDCKPAGQRSTRNKYAAHGI